MANRYGAAGLRGYPSLTVWAFFEHHRLEGHAHQPTLLGNVPLSRSDARTIRRWYKSGGHARRDIVHRMLSEYGFSTLYFQRWCTSRDLKLS